MNWISYWNAAPSVYVSDRHKRVHYAAIARDLVRHVPRPDAVVVDFGCGEALSADIVANACGRLILSDGAESVRQGLATRFAGRPAIAVATPEELERTTPESVDLIVVNSVVQYLPLETLRAGLGTWRRLLAPNGALLLADIIPRQVGPLQDAAALLRFAASHGFLIAAGLGLVRTALSDYRRIRSTLGLTQLDEAEVLALLAAHGLEGRRVHPNIGHNQNRMAFLAGRRAD